MGNAAAIEKKEQKPLALATVEGFTSEQVALVRDTVAKGCSELELKLFLHVSKIKKLDPFSGQVHPVKRWDSTLGRESMTVQTGIDGYRVIAARTGEHAGTDDVIYDSEDEEQPKKATVTVYRWSEGKGLGVKIPYTATARFNEYAQRKKDGGLNSMWTRMPYLMLGKVAEALALRKAFPDELSGILTFEEMGQADNPEPEPTGKRPPVTQPKRQSEKQAEQQQQQAETQSQTENKEEKFTGSIAGSKPNKRGDLFFYIDTTLFFVPADKVDDDMKDGQLISVRAKKEHHQKLGDYYEVVGVLAVESSGEEKKPEEKTKEQAAEASTEPAAEPVGEDVKTIGDLFASGEVKKASDLPPGNGKKPGTIGEGRATRLFALCNTNKKKNNGFNHDRIKEILALFDPPIEHTKDMFTEDYERFEKWATGEEDYRPFLERAKAAREEFLKEQK